MKPSVTRRLGWVALAGAIVGVSCALWLGFQRLIADETTGLKFVGPVADVSVAAPPGEEFKAFRLRAQNAWLSTMGEPDSEKLSQSPNRETYRFSYQPSFHPNICVSIWRESDRYWIRSSVCRWDGLQQFSYLWEKTQPLSIGKWNRIREAFAKRSVIDPLGGQESSPGIDGSSWILESIVQGRSVSTEIYSPVETTGIPRLQLVRARPGLEDFVSTSRLMLDWGGIRVPEIY